MPVSNQFQCLFIHIPKTGGTSIETALQMRGDKIVERRDLLYGPVRSWLIRRMKPKTAYLQHLTYDEVKKIAPRVIAKGYFSFSFVRNPWARMVSVYNNIDGNLVRESRQEGLELEGLSFNEFVVKTKDLIHPHLRPQCDFICGNDGELQIDFLGRFERLEEDFAEICARLSAQVNLPWHNQATDKSESDYRAYYCAQTKEIIESRYRRDIDLFGYRF